MPARRACGGVSGTRAWVPKRRQRRGWRRGWRHQRPPPRQRLGCEGCAPSRLSTIDAGGGRPPARQHRRPRRICHRRSRHPRCRHHRHRRRRRRCRCCRRRRCRHRRCHTRRHLHSGGRPANPPPTGKSGGRRCAKKKKVKAGAAQPQLGTERRRGEEGGWLKEQTGARGLGRHRAARAAPPGAAQAGPSPRRGDSRRRGPVKSTTLASNVRGASCRTDCAPRPARPCLCPRCRSATRVVQATTPSRPRPRVSASASRRRCARPAPWTTSLLWATPAPARAPSSTASSAPPPAARGCPSARACPSRRAGRPPSRPTSLAGCATRIRPAWTTWRSSGRRRRRSPTRSASAVPSVCCSC